MGTLATPSQAAAANPSVAAMINTAAAGYSSVPGLANVALAVASHESQLSPTAQNPGSSACGVFQLTSAAQSYFDVGNCLDPQQNVTGGVDALAQYYLTYGNWPKALQAFSDGPGTVNAGASPSGQTQGLIAYVSANTPAGTTDDTGASAEGVDTVDSSASGDLVAGVSGNGSGIDWTTVGLIGAAAAAAIMLS